MLHRESETDRPGRTGRHDAPPMIEILRTNDLVALSYAEALLKDAGIPSAVLDHHTSALEGSVWAIRRRLLVDDEDADAARRLLADAGIDAGR